MSRGVLALYVLASLVPAPAVRASGSSDRVRLQAPSESARVVVGYRPSSLAVPA